MSSTIKRAALGTMQDIPVTSSYDGDAPSQRGGYEGTQSPQRGSKMSESARLSYATGDDYSIDNYSIEAGGIAKMNSTGTRSSPSRSIDLSRIGAGGGGDNKSMVNSSSEGHFETNVPRAGSRGSRRMHREALEKKNEEDSALAPAPAHQEMKSLRKQQLERELELLETEIQRKRDVIDKTEGEASRAYDGVAHAKDEESDALYRQRQAKLAAQAEEARRQREMSRATRGDDGNDNEAQGKSSSGTNNTSEAPSATDGRSSAFDEERKRFERERNELQEKLELMEMQNKMLANRIELTETRAQELIKEEEKKREAVEPAELEAKQTLELERAERTLALSQLEGQTRDQLESEKQEKEALELERAKLRAKLAAIEASEKDAQETVIAGKAEREELVRSLEEERQRVAEVERAQLLTSEQLEEEKRRREEAIAKLEDEKHSMMKEQEARHKAIASEKEELRTAMKAMEEEKKSLYLRVEDTELKAQEEIQQLELHKVEYEMSIRRLEEEKQQLDSKMRSVEQESELVTEAMAEQLAAEKSKLLEEMKKLEDEKTSLASSLDESTTKSLRAQEEMTKRLEQERAQLKSSLEKMEDEKKTLAAHLEQSIKDSREQSKAIQDKATEEHSQLQHAIQQAEVEKEEIARRLAENQAQAVKEEESKNQVEHTEMLAQLEKERESLKYSMVAMAREKEDMQNQLRAAEEEARLEREKEVQRNMREKDELKAAVQKMKEELQREKAAAAEANKAAAAAAVAAAQAQRNWKESGDGTDVDRAELQQQPEDEEEGAVKTLKPSKSLYDMFQEEGPGEGGGPQLPRTLSKALLESPMPHTIDVIAEGDETQEDNIFGVEDSDDWGDNMSLGSRVSRASRGSRSGGTKKGSGDGGSSGEKKKAKKVEKQPDPFDDLPAPHAAAAGGDLTRLKMLGRLEPSLLSSFDAAHRCPLFYAVAYGQKEVTKFLVEQCPDMVDAVDAHGDTPLHAAASGGSSECMELLLETCSKLARKRGDGKDTHHGDSGNSLDSEANPATHHDNLKYGDIANPRNAMSMTPCHLARSPDVVEVLYNYGADLSAQDNNGRSSLFVACAMNREPCADFIINSLDREGKTDEIYEKDRRGDTALHAAACNGSVDCLLLLLQYGVDPTVGNIKSLKAIDLAARNGHVRCRDVLAEYHLHFCTSSEFDSVLFLATLQGHKRVKESERSRDNMPPSASEEEGSYSIIKKKSFSLNNGSGSGSGGGSGGGGSPGSSDMPKGLKHVQSMFSLKTQKSLRVQRWGEWIAYEDQQTSHIYWYNHSKSMGQWEKPEEVARLQLEAALDGGTGGSGNTSTPGTGGRGADMLSPAHTLSPKKSMRLKKHGDWIEYVTETAQTFFYNEKNGEFQWTAPPGVVPRSATKGDTTPQTSPSKQRDSPEHALLGNQATSGAMTPEATSQATKSAPSSGAGATHTDWQPYKDPDSGNIFWYNAVTQVSQWECPFDNVEVVAGEGQGAPDSSGAGEDAKVDDDDEEAVEVVGDDDLGI